jgi:hypothetical protein
MVAAVQRLGALGVADIYLFYFCERFMEERGMTT